MEPIDPRQGFETEPEAIVTDDDLWALVFMLVAVSLATLAAGKLLWTLGLCGLAELVLVLMWFKPESMT